MFASDSLRAAFRKPVPRDTTSKYAVAKDTAVPSHLRDRVTQVGAESAPREIVKPVRRSSLRSLDKKNTPHVVLQQEFETLGGKFRSSPSILYRRRSTQRRCRTCGDRGCESHGSRASRRSSTIYGRTVPCKARTELCKYETYRIVPRMQTLRVHSVQYLALLLRTHWLNRFAASSPAYAERARILNLFESPAASAQRATDSRTGPQPSRRGRAGYPTSGLRVPPFSSAFAVDRIKCSGR